LSNAGSADRDAIAQKAATLLVTLIGEPSAEDRDAIYRWVEECPEHAVAFAKAEAAWEQAERLKAIYPADSASGED
jgi:transmembrane sensor